VFYYTGPLKDYFNQSMKTKERDKEYKREIKKDQEKNVPITAAGLQGEKPLASRSM